ncbi:MAG TPA: FtsQ-type POTRA domain-containing protein [Micromonosporaceae bacterium]|nr:FtsQ-type POTRA domain-containing protein [Micromonosporaceae bacterium]
MNSGQRTWRLVRAGRDAIPNSVRRFNQRVRRRRWRAAAPWVVAGLVLLVIGLSAFIVYGTSLLGVRQIQVTGTDVVTPWEVRDAAGVPLGTPLARVDLAVVRDRIAALPPVARVEVHRDWPAALVIQVVERTPAAVVPLDKRYILTDASGVGYLTVDRPPAGLVVVRLPGRPDPADPTTRAALAVLGALTPKLRAQLVTLVADAPTRVRLELRNHRVVVWGDATDNETKAIVASSLLDKPGKEIDVSAPEVVTVR